MSRYKLGILYMKKILSINTLVLLLVTFCLSCSKKQEAESGALDQKEIVKATVKIATPSKKLSTASKYTKTDYYFSLPDIEGEKINLVDHKNRPVFIMWFSSDCRYCTASVDMAQRISKKYADRGLLSLAITYQGEEENAKQFAKYTGLTMLLAFDDGTVENAYGTRGVPNFFLLDKKHNLAGKWLGYSPLLEQIISDEIEKTL